MYSTHEEVIKYQQKCIEELKALQNKLVELPKKLNEFGLQKLNSVCFVPAKIYHTNEIMVHLGNDYFVERTSFQARDIVDRRIKVYEQNLEGLNAQKKVTDKKRIVEIQEPVEPQKEESSKKDEKPKEKQQATSIPKKIQVVKPEVNKQNEEQEIEKEKKEETSSANSSLSYVLSLMNQQNFKIDDYASDEELEEDQDDVEIEESEEKEKIQIKSASTPTQKSNLKKQSSNSEKEKRKSVQFGEQMIFEPPKELTPEEILKEKEHQMKERIAKLDQRAKDLGNEDEEQSKQQQQKVVVENIMEKIKPKKEEKSKSSKKQVQQEESDEEEEEQPKKVSRFKQRMMEQKN